MKIAANCCVICFSCQRIAYRFLRWCWGIPNRITKMKTDLILTESIMTDINRYRAQRTATHPSTGCCGISRALKSFDEDKA